MLILWVGIFFPHSLRALEVREVSVIQQLDQWKMPLYWIQTGNPYLYNLHLLPGNEDVAKTLAKLFSDKSTQWQQYRCKVSFFEAPVTLSREKREKNVAMTFSMSDCSKEN